MPFVAAVLSGADVVDVGVAAPADEGVPIGTPTGLANGGGAIIGAPYGAGGYTGGAP